MNNSKEVQNELPKSSQYQSQEFNDRNLLKA